MPWDQVHDSVHLQALRVSSIRAGVRAAGIGHSVFSSMRPPQRLTVLLKRLLVHSCSMSPRFTRKAPGKEGTSSQSPGTRLHQQCPSTLDWSPGNGCLPL